MKQKEQQQQQSPLFSLWTKAEKWTKASERCNCDTLNGRTVKSFGAQKRAVHEKVFWDELELNEAGRVETGKFSYWHLEEGIFFTVVHIAQLCAWRDGSNIRCTMENYKVQRGIIL